MKDIEILEILRKLANPYTNFQTRKEEPILCALIQKVKFEVEEKWLDGKIKEEKINDEIAYQVTSLIYHNLNPS